MSFYHDTSIIVSVVYSVVLLLNTCLFADYSSGRLLDKAEAEKVLSKIHKSSINAENIAGAMLTVQKEYFLPSNDDKEVIERVVSCVEFDGSCKMTVSYPGLSPDKYQDGANLYYPMDVLVTPKNSRVYIEYLNHGRVLPRDQAWLFDVRPITNLRPFRGRTIYTVSEYLNDLDADKSLKVEVYEQSGVYKLVTFSNGLKRVTEFDSKKDYSITKFEIWDNDKLRIVREFEDFVQKDGVWISKNIEEQKRSTTGEMVKILYITEVADFQYEIPNGIFDMKFPVGALITDSVKGFAYKIPDVNVKDLSKLSLNEEVKKKVDSGTEDGGIDGKVAVKKSEVPKYAAIIELHKDVYREINVQILIAMFTVVCIMFVVVWRKKNKNESLKIKYILSSIVVIVALGVVCVQWYFSDVSDTKRRSKLYMTGDKVAFGEIVNSEEHVAQVKIVNKSSYMINIESVLKSCGCTRVEIDKFRINSGENALLTIFYKPSENVVKNVNENVVLKINEPSVTELMIPFSVNMNPPVILNSLSLTAESTSVGAMGSLIIHAWPQISVDKISPQIRGTEFVRIKSIQRPLESGQPINVLLEIDGKGKKSGKWDEKLDFNLGCSGCVDIPIKIQGYFTDTVLVRPSIVVLKPKNDVVEVELNGLPYNENGSFKLNYLPKGLIVTEKKKQGDPNSTIVLVDYKKLTEGVKPKWRTENINMVSASGEIFSISLLNAM